MTQYRHVMVDIETLSTENNAMILSIGAVKFNLNETITGQNDMFHVGIEYDTCPPSILEKFHVSYGTVKWWMDPDRAGAREALSSLEKVDIFTALMMFSMWLDIDRDPKDFGFWGNGSDFDNVILSNAFKATGVKVNWPFFSNRCYRTMKNYYMVDKPLAATVKALLPTRNGMDVVPHDALYDAMLQALHLQKIQLSMFHDAG